MVETQKRLVSSHSSLLLTLALVEARKSKVSRKFMSFSHNGFFKKSTDMSVRTFLRAC